MYAKTYLTVLFFSAAATHKQVVEAQHKSHAMFDQLNKLLQFYGDYTKWI